MVVIWNPRLGRQKKDVAVTDIDQQGFHKGHLAAQRFYYTAFEKDGHQQYVLANQSNGHGGDWYSMEANIDNYADLKF